MKFEIGRQGLQQQKNVVLRVPRMRPRPLGPRAARGSRRRPRLSSGRAAFARQAGATIRLRAGEDASEARAFLLREHEPLRMVARIRFPWLGQVVARSPLRRRPRDPIEGVPRGVPRPDASRRRRPAGPDPRRACRRRVLPWEVVVRSYPECGVAGRLRSRPPPSTLGVNVQAAGSRTHRITASSRWSRCLDECVQAMLSKTDSSRTHGPTRRVTSSCPLPAPTGPAAPKRAIVRATHRAPADAEARSTQQSPDGPRPSDDGPPARERVTRLRRTLATLLDDLRGRDGDDQSRRRRTRSAPRSERP